MRRPGTRRLPPATPYTEVVCLCTRLLFPAREVRRGTADTASNGFGIPYRAAIHSILEILLRR